MKVPSSGVIAFLVSIILAPALTGCANEESSSAQATEQPVAVQAWTVERTRLVTERAWTGRLEPLRSLPVQAPGAGRIGAIHVRDGDVVERGDLLAVVEGPGLEARRVVLAEQRNQLAEELARWRRLAEQGAAGPGEVAQAELRLLGVREELETLEATAGSFELRAPGSGRVYGTALTVGANVSAGQTVTSIEDGASSGVRLVIPASETGYLEQLDLLRVVDDRGVPLSIDRVIFSSDPHPALVRAEVYLGSEVDPGHRSVTVTFHSDEEVLLVPWTAVASEDDRHWVGRIVAGEPERVERTNVELGRPAAAGIEVTAGLAEGDRILRYEPRSHPDGRAVTGGGPAAPPQTPDPGSRDDMQEIPGEEDPESGESP